MVDTFNEDTKEYKLWEVNEKTGDLIYVTDQLETLALCFPHLDLNVQLTPETFAAVLWFGAVTCRQNFADGSLASKERQEINALVDLWRQQITNLQTKIDALPTDPELPHDPEDISRWSRSELQKEIKRLRMQTEGDH